MAIVNSLCQLAQLSGHTRSGRPGAIDVQIVGKSSRLSDDFVASPSDPVQVAVVDDHALVGKLVVGMLQRAGFTAAIAFRPSLEETWAAVESLSPELIILDFDLGPGQSSLELLDRAAGYEIPVAGLTASDDRIEHARFLEAGGAAVISKSCGPADLVAVVELAIAGKALMAPSDRHALLTRLRKRRAWEQRQVALFAQLTPREADTLVLIAQGSGAADIADQWQIALPTVRTHIRSILTKLGVTSQLAAAALARDTGWYATITESTSSILTMPSAKGNGTIAGRSGSLG